MICAVVCNCCCSGAWLQPELHADSPAFDLPGPRWTCMSSAARLRCRLARFPTCFPETGCGFIPTLPESQSAHFVLIVAFLRGATNPPPPEWFTRVETWTRQAREEGVFVTVPAEAQQALIFLAPETGGDFSTCALPCAAAPALLCAPRRTCRRPVGTGCGWTPTWPR
jgi:hypothetical protein